jgi:hypothetical protein
MRGSSDIDSSKRSIYKEVVVWHKIGLFEELFLPWISAFARMTNDKRNAV